MKDETSQYLIISKPISHKNFGGRIVGLVLSFLLAGCFLISGLNHKPFIDLSTVIVGFALSIAFLAILLNTLKLKKVRLTYTQLIIGKRLVIERNQIKSFCEENHKVKTKNGFDIWDELFLFTDNDFITISSKIHPHYIQLKGFLTKGIPKYKNEEIYNRYLAIKATLRKTIVLFLLGIACITFPLTRFFYLKYIKSDITYSELKGLKGTIGNFPETIFTGKHNDKEVGVRIRLQEYPYFEFNFYMRDFAKSDYYDFKNAVIAGTPISIYISLDEYKKKISNELPIKVNDKYFNFNKIKTFAAKYNDREWRTGYPYVTESPEQMEMSYFTLFVIYLLIGGFTVFLYNGFQSWREYKDLLYEQQER